MHYLVDRKVFETKAEAIAYADSYFAKTGVLLGITETTRKVTHIYTVK